MQTKYAAALASMLIAAAATSAFSQTIKATQTNPSGVYAVGDKVTWKFEATGDNAASLTAVPYSIKKNLLTVLSEGKIDLSKGPVELSGTIDEPGTIGVSMVVKPGDKVQTYVGGAIFGPEKIQPTSPPPDDFDAFWDAKLAAVNAIPLNPQIEKASADKPGVDYYKVRLDNINGTHVYGQLARPAKEGKCPAVLILQSAGVGPLPTYNVVPRAMQGYIALNIMAHDLPFDADAAFYKNANETTHKGYITFGNDDREKSYFLRMYLSCVQAARYLKSRDDWDGKTLVIMGTSQGGQQTLVTAGLVDGVTAMLANVPAGCDATATLHGRNAGFPYWRGWGHEPNKATIEVGRYFDAANFAHRIKAPALVAMGLIDETCPAACVMSAFNQIAGTKERIIMPLSDHHGSNGAQADYYNQQEKWLIAIAKGQPLPPPKQPQE